MECYKRGQTTTTDGERLQRAKQYWPVISLLKLEIESKIRIASVFFINFLIDYSELFITTRTRAQRVLK